MVHPLKQFKKDWDIAAVITEDRYVPLTEKMYRDAVDMLDSFAQALDAI
ncbi:hypothetical protein [Lysinibacillus xylanilyticus]